MSLLILSAILVFVLVMIGVNAYHRYKAETHFEHIDSMHPTLVMAHTIANRNQKAYALVRNELGGVSVVEEGCVGLVDPQQKVLAVVRPIPIGREYKLVPYEFMQPIRSKPCEPTARTAGLPALLDLQPSS